MRKKSKKKLKTLKYEEPPEEKNKIKMLSSFFLYEHLLKIKKE